MPRVVACLLLFLLRTFFAFGHTEFIVGQAHNMATNEDLSLLCNKLIADDNLKLTLKGFNSLVHYSILRNDKAIEEYLTEHRLDVHIHNLD